MFGFINLHDKFINLTFFCYYRERREDAQGTVLTTLKKAGILAKGSQLLIWLRCASGLHGEVGNLPSIHYVGSGAAGSSRSIATQSQAFFN